jgi:hypothetical protein
MHADNEGDFEDDTFALEDQWDHELFLEESPKGPNVEVIGACIDGFFDLRSAGFACDSAGT